MRKQKTNNTSTSELVEHILDTLSQKDYVPTHLEELMRLLRLGEQKKSVLVRTLGQMEKEGKIARIKKNRYALPLDADLIPGRIRMNRRGQGTLFPENPDMTPIPVPPEATGTAMHDDRVLVRREVRPGDPASARGTVIRVLERARSKVVGTLLRSKQLAYVAPDDPRIIADIAIPADQASNIPTGHKVVVELREWKSRHMSPEGEIVDVLGKATEPGVDMRGIITHYQLPTEFPRAVLNEAKALGTEVREAELKGRLDCREHLVVTIDPDDAKDFDDAICLQPVEHGRMRLWVHIADVSHYVKPGTALDKEARLRGNSTYLVDRVIPMLPESLSNELCSLKPGVARLTKCVEFLLDRDARVLSVNFHEAVILSKRRFAYQEVRDILRAPARDDLGRMLHAAHRVAQLQRQRRFKRGALNLEFPETKIRLDARGRVRAVEVVEHDESHQLIEEFMLMTNEAVARTLRRLQRPSVYRVHEPPDPEKLEDLRALVKAHDIACGDLSAPGEMMRLMKKIASHDAAPALSVAVLRSMKRARYTNQPLGHYGLAATDYTHFTSPIRRYADLLVHRALFGGKSSVPDHARLAEITDHISTTERISQDAERDSRDVKMMAWFESQLATRQEAQPVFEAIITEIRSFGFFVDIAALAYSGLVPVSSLEDDLYRFDAAGVRLVGRRRGRVFALGQRVHVGVLRVDRLKKQVDFKLVESSPDRRM